MEKLKLLDFLRFTETSLFKRIAKFDVPQNLSKIPFTGRGSAPIAKVYCIELLNTRHVIFSMA